jgi:hypothetical protein
MTLDDVLRLLAADCYTAGGQHDWAKAHEFSPAFVSAVLNKRKPPSERLLRALGLERVTRTVTTYRRVR